MKRKKYDSSLPFDEKFPDEKDIEDDEDFFVKWTRVFNNNARFSVNKPVPTIGDMNTPMEEVFKFYSFWDDFKTWREFSQYHEYDPEEAADRYEKRWMEQQNKKLTDKHVKAERKRLNNMADMAYRCDPRVKAHLAKEAAEKEAIKQAKKDAKAKYYQDIEDKKRQEEEEEKRKEQEAEEQKAKEKEAKRLAQKKYRETVKEMVTFAVTKMPGTKYDKFFFGELIKKYPKQEQIDELFS